ncbi:MAG: hypothetical protein LBU00_03535 [Treponema sp.]|jgi:hypothetical protein|nr:hypothetical protein [Treponema sp.]
MSCFPTRLVPAPAGYGKLFEERPDAPDEPVVCLGKTFASEEERRAYFTEELRSACAILNSARQKASPSEKTKTFSP